MAASSSPVLLRVQLGNDNTDAGGTLVVQLDTTRCLYSVFWDGGTFSDGTALREFRSPRRAMDFALEQARLEAVEVAAEFES